MDYYKEKSALITGAASGIGLTLARRLHALGARLMLTDIDEVALRNIAEELGEAAQYETLDVRDYENFSTIVREFKDQSGSLDLFFNNAGIGIGGELFETPISHYQRIIDVNIGGVCNGVAVVYPLLVEQGSGQIINTASAAGLLPIPLMANYAMTKHAVVGLSKSMRLEAETHNVGVTVLCPTAIETPLLDSEGPTDLTAVWRPDIRNYLTKLGGTPMPVEDFVDHVLRKLPSNPVSIIAPARARLLAKLFALFPGLLNGTARKLLAEQREQRKAAD